jgi:hypothetical protein
MASPPNLTLTLAAGILVVASSSPLGAAWHGCPPGYIASKGICAPKAKPGAKGCPPGYSMATGVCKPASQPKPACPPGYTIQATGVCKPSPQPKPGSTVCPRGQTPDRQGKCPR